MNTNNYHITLELEAKKSVDDTVFHRLYSNLSGSDFFTNVHGGYDRKKIELHVDTSACSQDDAIDKLLIAIDYLVEQDTFDVTEVTAQYLLTENKRPKGPVTVKNFDGMMTHQAFDDGSNVYMLRDHNNVDLCLVELEKMCNDYETLNRATNILSEKFDGTTYAS